MTLKSLDLLLLILMAETVLGVAYPDYIDINRYSASYYDLKTGLGLRGELEDSGRDPLSSPKIAFRGLPCYCESLTCGCCAGINLTTINFNRRACTKFTYDPYQFSIKMAVSMNEKEIYSNSVSAKNPPPICLPFAYFPALSFCVRFFDIHMPGRNLHACVDFETRIIGSPILILHFNCVKVGFDGIAWLKPDDSTQNMVQCLTYPQEPEVYDDVNFEQQDVEIVSNLTTTLSPQQEAEIGQLKL